MNIINSEFFIQLFLESMMAWFMNTTFNFTSHINEIGFTHEMYDELYPSNNKEGSGPTVYFYILNKAFGILFS